MPEPELDYVKKKFIYIGIRESAKGEHSHVYLPPPSEVDLSPDVTEPLSTDWEFDKSLWFGKSLGTIPIGGIGELLVAQREGGGTTAKGKIVWDGTYWPVKSDRAKWQSVTATIEQKRRVSSEAKKNKYKDLDESIELMRAAYRRVSLRERGNFVAYLVYRITKGI